MEEYSMDDIQKIAGVMKKYRERKKISAQDIAKALGLSKQAFYGYESGKQKIQLALFVRWSQALGIRVRSAAEAVEEAITGVKRSHLSKKEQELRKARALLKE